MEKKIKIIVMTVSNKNKKSVINSIEIPNFKNNQLLPNF